MKKFAFKFFIFLALNAAIAILALQATDRSFQATNSDSQSHLFTIPSNSSYDLVILGTSRARKFARGPNLQAVEKILHMKQINLAKNSAGILPEKLYLSYFLAKGNQARTVLYFIDPFVFYSPRFNEEYSFSEEPVRLGVLFELIKDHFKPKIILEYVKSKFTPSWLRKESLHDYEPNQIEPPFRPEGKEDSVRYYNNFYPSGTSETLFNAHLGALEDIIHITHEHHIRLVFAIPPTLWSKDPQYATVKKFFTEHQNQYGVEFYDLSETIKDPIFYADRSHLNQEGVAYLTARFLKPILTQTDSQKTK